MWPPLRLAMSALPAAYVGAHSPRNRFRAAVRLAGVVRPLMIAFRLHKHGSRYVTRQDVQTQALFAVMRGARRFALDMPVDIRVEGIAPVSGPGIVVTLHNMLNQFVVARLARQGVPVAVVVRVANPPYVVGCSLPMDFIAADPAVSMLRAVIRRFDACKVVFAAIDQVERLATHPHRLPIPGVERYCSSQLIRLAVERRVPVLFCHTRLVGREVIATIHRADAHDAEDIVRQFGEFVAECHGPFDSAQGGTPRARPGTP
jgi:hypothetical protein